MARERVASARKPRVLVAGMGNVLRQDDGFGVEVARRLLTTTTLPGHVSVIEVGIGGISLVQELMSSTAEEEREKYDVLIVIDAVQRDGPPGRVYVLEASVPELDAFPEPVRRDFLADMHFAVPARALVLAKALGVLPPKTWIVGCQPDATDDFEIGLSAPVASAVETAVAEIRTLINGNSAEVSEA